MGAQEERWAESARSGGCVELPDDFGNAFLDFNPVLIHPEKNQGCILEA